MQLNDHAKHQKQEFKKKEKNERQAKDTNCKWKQVNPTEPK